LTNLCGAIPYQFGGDGAVALVPPGDERRARVALARTRAFAQREFGLELRVALITVAALAARGGRVLVGRYEPIDGAAYAVFGGGGLARLEAAVKGTGDAELAQLAMVGDLDDGEPPDLTGLSCRWTPVHAADGRMVSLVLRGGDHRALHREIARLAGVARLGALSLDGIRAHWPPKGLMREARARHGRAPLALSVVRVAWESLVAYVFFRLGLRTSAFDAARYVRELTKCAVDFARSDDTLCLVFDCPAGRIEAVRAYLEGERATGRLRYGMQVSDHAVMTCLVGSTESGGHVHFVDGGDGGYTRAATQMKSQA
jgi:hypothetical protein